MPFDSQPTAQAGDVIATKGISLAKAMNPALDLFSVRSEAVPWSGAMDRAMSLSEDLPFRSTPSFSLNNIFTNFKDSISLLAHGVGDFFVSPAWAALVPNPISYTSMTLQDSGKKVTVMSNCLTYSNLETYSGNTYVWRNFSTQGDFIYEFDGILSSGDTFTQDVVLWGVSNTANETWDDWTDGLLLSYLKSGSTLQVWLRSKSGGGNWFTNVTMNTRYYFRVKRVGTTVTAEIYSNSARTTLVATLSLTASASTTYQYLYGLDTQDGSGTGNKATGDVCNLVQMVNQSGPSAPVLNSAQAGNRSVILNWGSVSGATGYKVKYGTAPGSYTTIIEAGNVLTKKVTGLQNGTRRRRSDLSPPISTLLVRSSAMTVGSPPVQAPAACRPVDGSVRR